MSASDAGVTIGLTGASLRDNPADAVREALTCVAGQLAAAGGAPHHLATMRWHAMTPAAFHPAQRAIDLACREVFVGFMPAIALERAAGPGLRVEATALIPPPAAPAPVWRGYTAPELARQ
jgi:arylformamidase